jgi:hypothetical protein
VLHIKYEYLMESKIEALKSVYKFIGRPMGQEVIDAWNSYTTSYGSFDNNSVIALLLQTQEIIKSKIFLTALSLNNPFIQRGFLFSTYRNLSTYDPNHWKNHLSSEEIDRIRQSESCNLLNNIYRYYDNPMY